MNVLYIADPNLIHDFKWIHTLREIGHVTAYLVARKCHAERFQASEQKLEWQIPIVQVIRDPSTLWFFATFFEALKLRGVIRRHQIDLIHIFYGEPNALWVNWRFMFNVPILITLRGTDILKTIPDFFKKKGLLAKIVSLQYRHALNSCCAITITSEAQRNSLQAMSIKTSTFLVRTGIELPGVTTEQPLVQGNYILMPRKMRPIYNHEFTIEAIRLLAPRFRNKFTFVFVDSDTEYIGYLENIKRQAATVPASFLFLPTLQNHLMFSLYRNARIVIMNPSSDGSPVTAMEAIACGAPVILPPLPYDLDVFNAAFFFPKWSPTSLQAAIENVLQMDETKLQKHLSNASNQVKENLSTKSEMERIMKIYNEICHKD